MTRRWDSGLRILDLGFWIVDFAVEFDLGTVIVLCHSQALLCRVSVYACPLLPTPAPWLPP